MADRNSIQRELDEADRRVNSVQYYEINELPETISLLVNELKHVEESYIKASKMSNLGTTNFVAAMDGVISQLQETKRLLGDIRLK